MVSLVSWMGWAAPFHGGADLGRLVAGTGQEPKEILPLPETLAFTLGCTGSVSGNETVPDCLRPAPASLPHTEWVKSLTLGPQWKMLNYFVFFNIQKYAEHTRKIHFSNTCSFLSTVQA